MNPLTVETEGADLTTLISTIPAPIRLVHAFRDAVRASIAEADLSREALAVEVLVIAGMASFDALTRLDVLFRAIAREGGSIMPFERREVGLANKTWYETSMTLRSRMDRLESKGYESESFTVFSNAIRKSSEIELESRERQLLERQALRTVELVALAAKLKPRQDVYDDGEEG